MTSNREKAQKFLDEIDELQDRSASFRTPTEVEWFTETAKFLYARAQVHATLALTDPKEES